MLGPGNQMRRIQSSPFNKFTSTKQRGRITQICAKKHAMMYVPNAGTEGGVVCATQRAILQSANIWLSGSGPRRGVGVIAETREEQGSVLVELTL